MSVFVEQARDFLKKTGTQLECVFEDSIESPIRYSGMRMRHCNQYTVTIWNDRGEHEFKYTGSINDFEKGIEPTTYDILAGIGSGVPESFIDFCEEFDYQVVGRDVGEAEEQIREIRDTHQKCLSMSVALQKMFTEDELELLQSIQ